MFSFFIDNILFCTTLSLLATIALVVLCVMLPRVWCNRFKLKLANHLVMALVTVIFLFNTFLFVGVYRLKTYIHKIEQNVGSVQEFINKYPAIFQETGITNAIDVEQQSISAISFVYDYINAILLKSASSLLATLLLTVILFVYLAKKQERKKNQYKKSVSNANFGDLEF